MADEHVDVLIIGAGISGISTACHLAATLPGKRYTILERRTDLGGTWDLFRYPGIRSDSDMMTFAFGFRPWRNPRILADGDSIRTYLRDTADEYGITDHIRFGTRVVSADFSTATGRWTVTTTHADGTVGARFTAGFLVAGTGYYDYDAGHRPRFPGEDDYAGTLVHPQHWPADLDHAGRSVVIVGSGATAVTLVPALAETAAHVTMLQRSPTYIMSLPVVDHLTAALQRVLPDALVYRTTRARNIGVQRALYALAKAQPTLVKRLVRRGVERQLRGSSDLAHFTPRYDPWDQRLCFVPDGDLFKAVRSGRADVVTDSIETFTPTGIRLASGAELPADIVVTATGLSVQLLGGAELSVDGAPVPIDERVTYKGVMLEGVPNAALIFGYVNASWTLKADLSAEWICRLLAHLEHTGADQVVAHAGPRDRNPAESVLGALNAGYVRRGDAHLPRQGTHGPWKVTHDYFRDAFTLRHRAIDDGILRFTSTPEVERGDVTPLRGGEARTSIEA